MKNLADALKECRAIKFGDFTLASGKKSKFYVDIKKASTNPVLLKLIASRISVSLETGSHILMIRKEAKEYGTKGQIVGDVNPGSKVVLVDDVTTTGGSVIKAIQVLRDEGLIIRHVITIVDREEGALESLASADVELIPLVRLSELLKK